MQLTITDHDYEEALGAKQARALKDGQKEAILGDNDQPAANQAVLDALPRVLVDRFKKMIPADYEVKQVAIKVQISGQPFGVGIGGDATVTFGPSTTKT